MPGSTLSKCFESDIRTQTDTSLGEISFQVEIQISCQKNYPKNILRLFFALKIIFIF